MNPDVSPPLARIEQAARVLKREYSQYELRMKTDKLPHLRDLSFGIESDASWLTRAKDELAKSTAKINDPALEAARLFDREMLRILIAQSPLVRTKLLKQLRANALIDSTNTKTLDGLKLSSLPDSDHKSAEFLFTIRSSASKINKAPLMVQLNALKIVSSVAKDPLVLKSLARIRTSVCFSLAEPLIVDAHIYQFDIENKRTLDADAILKEVSNLKVDPAATSDLRVLAIYRALHDLAVRKP